MQRFKLAIPFAAVASLVLAFGVAACGDDDEDSTPTPASPTTPAPTETPTPGETAAPSPTVPAGMTGDSDLDPIVEAIESRDTAALVALVRFTEIACVDKVDVGSPPECPAGVPTGSVVEALPMSQCEGYYVFEDQLDAALTTLLDRGLELYAAYEQPNAGTDAFPMGDKVLLYEEGTTGFGRMVNVADGVIVSITEMCASTPAQVIQNGGIADFILEPAA